MGPCRHTGEGAEAIKGHMGIRLSHYVNLLSTSIMNTNSDVKQMLLTLVSSLVVILHTSNGIH